MRVLTQNQREKFEKDREYELFQQEMQKQDQLYEQELAEIEKREKEKVASANEKVEEPPKDVTMTEEERVEKYAVKPGEYVVDQ